MAKIQRARDPVHGLIVFEREGDDPRRDQTGRMTFARLSTS
jgi:hypothetical protein